MVRVDSDVPRGMSSHRRKESGIALLTAAVCGVLYAVLSMPRASAFFDARDSFDYLPSLAGIQVANALNSLLSYLALTIPALLLAREGARYFFLPTVLLVAGGVLGSVVTFGLGWNTYPIRFLLWFGVLGKGPWWVEFPIAGYALGLLLVLAPAVLLLRSSRGSSTSSEGPTWTRARWAACLLILLPSVLLVALATPQSPVSRVGYTAAVAAPLIGLFAFTAMIGTSKRWWVLYPLFLSPLLGGVVSDLALSRFYPEVAPTILFSNSSIIGAWVVWVFGFAGSFSDPLARWIHRLADRS